MSFYVWCRERDSNPRRLCQMIYSHPCLTASLSLPNEAKPTVFSSHPFGKAKFRQIGTRCCSFSLTHCSKSEANCGADDRARTCDPRFTKPLLYQLSYIGLEQMSL